MTGLSDHLIRRIRLEGPLTLAQYMEECLANPQHGYYTTRDPLGAGGDFVTSPEISQMFGELIGVWAHLVWQTLGSPPGINLIEAGPGRGTLMSDVIRSVRPFRRMAKVNLIELSPVLRDAQRQALSAHGLALEPRWLDGFAHLPEGPAIFIANEFFDALPIRQFRRTEKGWQELLIGLDRDGALAPAIGPETTDDSLIPGPCRSAAPGEVVEVCPGAMGIAHAIGDHLKTHGGAALIIDYGHLHSAPGDTFQAVRGHDYTDPLERPGEADLTAHVDFQMLAEAAMQGGAVVSPPTTQGAFLQALGIDIRCQFLATKASAAQAEVLKSGRDRLVGDEAMGRLFKVLGLASPGLGPLAGFPE
ncbi:MAG: class I SAM-dependent methyltransferase [Magnetovibrionaceae bacterium]